MKRTAETPETPSPNPAPAAGRLFPPRLSLRHLTKEQRRRVARTQQRLLLRSPRVWIGWGCVAACWLSLPLAFLWRWMNPPAAPPPAGGWLLSWQSVALIEAPPVLLAAFVLEPLSRRLYRRALALNGLCASCGYDVRFSPSRCPECGTSRSGSEAATDVA